MYSDSDSDSSSIAGEVGLVPETDQRCPHVPKVVINGATQSSCTEGYLYKQGGVKRDQGWKRRYMKFDGETLRYYKDKDSSVSLRMIPVSIMLNVQAIKDGRRASTSSLFSSGKSFQFELECTNRTFQFGTDDHDYAVTWENYLMAAIIDHKKHSNKPSDGGKMANPDTCGMIRFNKNKKKYYVAIKSDILRYYYNEDDYKIDSPIHELSMPVCGIKRLGKTQLQLSSPPNQFFVLSFDSADEATQWEMEIQEAIEEVLGDNSALDSVMELVANRTCADCQSPRVRFASVNLGIVLCIKCAGIHRGFGITVSFVQSLRMDKIFKDERLLQLLKAIGNANANAFWFKTPPADYKPDIYMAVPDRKILLTKKYLKRAFADLQKDDKEQLNKMFLASVRVNDIQKAMTFLYSGADISHESEEGTTAVEIAKGLGHTVLEVFLEQNKNIVLPRLFTALNGQAQMGDVPKKTAIYHEGYLEKTGPNMKGFLKRWCVLHYGILSYYQEKGKNSPKGTINIAEDIVAVTSSLCTEREHCFEISCKVKKRAYRFAVPDLDSRIAWMSACIKVICPAEILNEQLEECQTLAIAGVYYVKFEQGSWCRAWITLRGNRLDVWILTNMSHALTIILSRGSKLFKYNSGRSSKLVDSTEDYKHLDGNQCVEIVQSTRLTKFQGLLLKDTEKLYAFVEKQLAMSERRRGRVIDHVN